MTDDTEQTVDLHIQGSTRRPLRMRVAEVRRSGGGFTLLLTRTITSEDGARRIEDGSRPVLIGPAAEAVAFSPLSAMWLAPEDTLNLTVALSPESFRKLGLRG